MKKKKFIVFTKYSFNGHFEIQAYDKEQAREYIHKNCGLVLGGTIHSTLDTTSIDWNFPIHPKCTIVNIKEHMK